MSATQNESKRDYVRKLQELDINASDFDNKFDEINQQFNRNLEVSHKSYGRRVYANDYNSIDDFIISPFRSLSRMHNNLYKMMNINNFFDDKDLFFDKDEFNENKLDKLDVNTYDDRTDRKDKEENPKSYYKYVSSMTTYDNNGVRKAKSISRTEKYDGKEKKIKQVSKFQDGDKYVEEYLNPDGTTRRIEKKIDNNRMIE